MSRRSAAADAAMVRIKITYYELLMPECRMEIQAVMHDVEDTTRKRY